MTRIDLYISVTFSLSRSRPNRLKKQVSTLLEDSLIVQSVQLGPKDPRIEKHSLILLYVAKSLAMFTY